MIRIIAQVDPEEKIVPNQAKPNPADIPLADDDPIQGGESPISDDWYPDWASQSEPEPEQPAAPLPEPPPEALTTTEDEALEPAGELPPTEEQKPEPGIEFEELQEQESEWDVLNRNLTISQKITKSLVDQVPLRILYTTLKGHTTERTIEPDYVFTAVTTGNNILIAWDHLRGGWRGFIVNRIQGAKLEPTNE